MINTIMIPRNFAIDEATELREKLIDMIENNKYDFLLDFSNCTFIDSTGLGVLVSLYKRINEHRGTLKLIKLNHNVMRVFKLTRLDKVFEIK